MLRETLKKSADHGAKTGAIGQVMHAEHAGGDGVEAKRWRAKVGEVLSDSGVEVIEVEQEVAERLAN